jgi:hypothetical protein
MGMAASQARFLQLTARKSNDEYQGQQINQARTALANKSAGLFEKMLALQPPTPPSSMDDRYYSQGYGFTDPRDKIRKKITTEEMDVATASVTINPLTYYKAAFTSATISLPVDTTDLADLPTSAITGLNPPADTDKTVVRYATFEHTAYDPNGNYTIYTEQRPVVAFYDKLERLLDFQDLSFTAAFNSDPTSADYYNPGNATTAASHGNPAVADGAAPTMDNLVFTAVAAPSILKAKDASITLTNEETTYMNDLSYIGQFDDIAFQEAMDRYEFEKNAYDYQIERINLETKQIQAQDKSLELKLKQVDTDHKAIETEMDAVSKVITKNIESTFKTFA